MISSKPSKSRLTRTSRQKGTYSQGFILLDDDLLEILGQSREPLLVQKHIKKCFEGFKVMDIIPPGKQLNRNFEATGMRETSTGETAAFVSNVVLDGAVENWLVELEHAMKKSMQQLLAVSIQAHRGKDKEKWITDVQGQLL